MICYRSKEQRFYWQKNDLVCEALKMLNTKHIGALIVKDGENIAGVVAECDTLKQLFDSAFIDEANLRKFDVIYSYGQLRNPRMFADLFAICICDIVINRIRLLFILYVPQESSQPIQFINYISIFNHRCFIMQFLINLNCLIFIFGIILIQLLKQNCYFII